MGGVSHRVGTILVRPVTLAAKRRKQLQALAAPLFSQVKAWIGTSGFQYQEWKGKFYPEKTAPAKMLAFYATEFRSTELNYTFRSMPSVKTIDRWRDETPEDFRFSLKAPQRVTQSAKLRNCGDTLNHFRDAVKGLGQKLGPVLFQLPATFRCSRQCSNFGERLPRIFSTRYLS